MKNKTTSDYSSKEHQHAQVNKTARVQKQKIKHKYWFILISAIILVIFNTAIIIHRQQIVIPSTFAQDQQKQRIQHSGSVNNNKNGQNYKNCSVQNKFNENLQRYQNPNFKNYEVGQNAQKFYNFPLSHRAKLGQSSTSEHKAVFHKIINRMYHINNDNSGHTVQDNQKQNANIKKQHREADSQGTNNKICFVINSMNLITSETVKSINTILNMHSSLISHIILISDQQDLRGNSLILKQFKNQLQSSAQSDFVSDYGFIKNQIEGCQAIIYGFGNHIYTSATIINSIQEANHLQYNSLVYSASYTYAQQQTRLHKIQDHNIEDMLPLQLYKYMYIFDTTLLKLITPINFSFYSKYTIQQMIILPLLAITQGSGKMRASSKIVYGIVSSRYQQNHVDDKLQPLTFVSRKQFTLRAPLISQQTKRIQQFYTDDSDNGNTKDKQTKSFCFVSYPNNPFQGDLKDIIRYLQTISIIRRERMSVSLVLSVPYKFAKSNILMLISEKLLKFSKQNLDIKVRFRIMANKTVSSYAVYEAAYTYCPTKSIIISSRHNIVKFDRAFLNILSVKLTQKYHYYYVNVIDEQKTLTYFKVMPKFGTQRKFRKTRNSSLFQQNFMHVQIFKSDLLKSNIFWMLKNDEIDFYQTQSCFVTHMLESIKLQFKYINQTMIQIISRQKTSLQISQIENVKKFAQFSPLPTQTLVPYRHNCLQNPVYRRNAPDKIQKNIHQIWIGSSKISQVRWRLHKTVKDVNTNFNVTLWTLQNITKEVVPYTYQLITRVLQFHKTFKTSMYAMAADLLRYELVLRFGGIYLDFKFQALRPLDKFVKYQSFFLDYDIDIIRLGSPQAIGIGALGATKNNYHINFLLTQIINEYTVPLRIDINVITGGFQLRKVFNDQQLFTWIGIGYHLFIPLPYENKFDQCGSLQNKFDSDQEVYEVPDPEFNRTIKFGIPCKAYPESYLSLYGILAGTWVRPKSIIN